MPRRQTGLPFPRVADAGLQRFIELVATRLETVERTTERLGGNVERAQGDIAGLLDDGNEIPFLDTPPGPKGFEGLGGIGAIFLSWANPWRFYQNHAHTKIYRGATNQFDNAAEVATAPFTMYVDDTVQDDVDYFYWITWVSTADIEGPPSDALELRAAVDPEVVYQQVIDWLDSEPALESLAAPIPRLPDITAADTPPSVLRAISNLEENRRFAGMILRLADGTNRIERENLQAIIDTLTVLGPDPSGQTGYRLGAAPNRFSADTRSAAEALRNTQGMDHPTWLASYDANDRDIIILEY